MVRQKRYRQYRYMEILAKCFSKNKNLIFVICFVSKVFLLIGNTEEILTDTKYKTNNDNFFKLF